MSVRPRLAKCATLFALGVYSGLRLGDCATLRWPEVDMVRGIICRIPNKTARRNPKPVLVPIHPVTREMLAAESRPAIVPNTSCRKRLRFISAELIS